MFTAPLANGTLPFLRPPQPGPAAGTVDALFLLAWMRATRRADTRPAPAAAFFEGAPGGPGLLMATLRTNARSMGMDIATLKGRHSDTYTLFQGPGPDTLITRRIGKTAQVFPEAVGVGARVAALTDAQKTDLGISLDALWALRTQGAPFLADPYTPNLPDAPNAPAWQPNLPAPIRLQGVDGSPFPIFPRMHLFHQRREAGDFGAHLATLPKRNFTCVLTYGRALRLRDGTIGVGRPTCHIKALLIAPYSRTTTVVEEEHAFCADIADRFAALPATRLPYAAGLAHQTIPDQPAPGVALLKTSTSSFIMEGLGAATAHDRLTQAKTWDACSKEPPDSPRFVPTPTP